MSAALGTRKHLLMTRELRRALPALYSTEGQGMDAVALAKFFSPWSAWTLYVTEYDQADTLYGFCVNGSVREWGYSSLGEMESAEFTAGLSGRRGESMSWAFRIACFAWQRRTKPASAGPRLVAALMSPELGECAVYRIVCICEAADDFAVYGPRCEGPFGTPMVFRGSLAECLAWRRAR